MRREDLRKLSRQELVARARGAGIDHPDRRSDSELVEELARKAASERRISTMKSWFGVARDLVARVVDRGLHLPEAAQILRSSPPPATRQPPPPLPTVTLAEIYAAQGYYAKAVAVLDDVLSRKPDHAEAKRLREQYGAELSPQDREKLARRESSAGKREAPSEPAPASASEPAPAPSEPAPAPSEPAPVSAPAPEPASAPAPEPASAPAPEPASEAAARPLESPSVPPPPPVERESGSELVALATDPRTAYVYWELRPLRFARARQSDPEGRLVLRVLTVEPSSEGSRSESRDVPIDQLEGDRFVRGLSPGSELRLCLGWNGPRGFQPLLVAPELSMPRDYRASAPAAMWVDPKSLQRAFAAKTQEREAAGAAAAGKHMRRYLEQVAVRGPSPVLDFAKLAEVAPAERGGASDLSEPERGGASEQYGDASSRV